MLGASCTGNNGAELRNPVGIKKGLRLTFRPCFRRASAVALRSNLCCSTEVARICWLVLLLYAPRGSTAVAILGIYYIAPLTSLFKVLKERDSSSIYWPLSLANLANALLWMVYGMVGFAAGCWHQANCVV